jgi:branched-chain amino acid transport system ATP-binding protein
MHKSIDIIHDEHRALAAMLSGLRTIAAGIEAGRLQPDFELLAAMLRYIEEVPEKLHHPKEDGYLFARLRRRCAEAEPIIAELEAEHRRGAARMALLKAALGHYRTAGAAAFPAFHEAVKRYIDDEWRHMNAEESRIFPLAEKHLLAEDWVSIDAAFLANDNPWQGAAGEYTSLFSHIVNTAPAPVGLGG